MFRACSQSLPHAQTQHRRSPGRRLMCARLATTPSQAAKWLHLQATTHVALTVHGLHRLVASVAHSLPAECCLAAAVSALLSAVVAVPAFPTPVVFCPASLLHAAGCRHLQGYTACTVGRPGLFMPAWLQPQAWQRDGNTSRQRHMLHCECTSRCAAMLRTSSWCSYGHFNLATTSQPNLYRELVLVLALVRTCLTHCAFGSWNAASHKLLCCSACSLSPPRVEMPPQPSRATSRIPAQLAVCQIPPCPAPTPRQIPAVAWWVLLPSLLPSCLQLVFCINCSGHAELLLLPACIRAGNTWRHPCYGYLSCHSRAACKNHCTHACCLFEPCSQHAATLT
jgi:hypothetical protein